MKALREWFFLALANRLPRIPIFENIRVHIFQLAGLNIKGKCRIWGPLRIRPTGRANNIEIGEGSFINTDVQFGVPKDKVTIGKNVQIGPRVMFETAGHDLKNTKNWDTKPIVIEDNVWIAAGVIITQGITIGSCSVIAAGAVVTKNVEPHTLVGGIPAKLIRRLEL